jgi:hypothetical protein
MTTVTVTAAPISATVTQTGVAVAVASSSSSVTASGGIGPQGASGAAGGTLDQLTNVQIASAQPGDVLQYGSGSKWQNNPILDGGNW